MGERVTDQRPLNDLRSTGLLWLINTAVFHPRGYALGLHFDGDGACTGWSLKGDGTERATFCGENWPEGRTIDDAFRSAKALMP